MIREETEVSLKGLVDSGLYESEEKAIYEALKALFKENPEIRKKLAIYRYQNKEISLGKAAQIAGLCWEEMKDELIKNGIKPRLGPQTIEESKKDSLVIERYLSEKKDHRQ
jgi:predicted HTH domain antitoxin